MLPNNGENKKYLVLLDFSTSPCNSLSAPYTPAKKTLNTQKKLREQPTQPSKCWKSLKLVETPFKWLREWQNTKIFDQNGWKIKK